MNKTNFFSSLLVVALFATASVVTSCKDYDDDLKNLQSQIDGINKTLSQIQTLISSGSVITDVKTLTDGTGGVEIFLSNNKSYKIYNGAKGETGATGAQGEKGDKGDKGDTGAAGADGVAPVVTIGDNGNWFINGVDTGKPSRGEKGETGATGATGATGPQGPAGPQGPKGEAGVAGAKAVYYVPGTEGAEKGFWVKVDPNTDPETRTVTTEKWVGVDPNMVSAVMEKETGLLTLVNVQGATDTDENGNVVLSLNNALRSLVLVPTTVISSSKAIVVEEMIYQPYKMQDQDKKNETVANDGAAKTIHPLTKVQYHVNPSNADINKIKDAMAFQLQDTVDWAADNRNFTRAKSDKLALTLKSELTEFDSETGILTVYMDMTGTPATFDESNGPGAGSYVSMAALQVAKENGEFVTSDYATLVNSKNLDLVIANQKLFTNHKEDYHFRTLADGNGTTRKVSELDGNASAKVAGQKVWEDANVQAATEVDTVIFYTRNAADNTLVAEELNVKNLVGFHMTSKTTPTNCQDASATGTITWRTYQPTYKVKQDRDVLSIDEMKKLFPGWDVTLALVKNYKVGTNNTDQAEYVKFDAATGILSINTAYGASAINSFPIISVTLKYAARNIVKVSYIKVKVVERDGEPLEGLSLTMPEVEFKCEGNSVKNDYITISKQVYDVVNLTKDEFHTNYPTFTDDAVTGDVGTVTELNDDPGADDQNTHVLQWTFTADQLWANAGKTVTNFISYSNNGANKLTIKLTTTIKGIKKTYDITSADYYAEYWNAELTQARFNVNVPSTYRYAYWDKTLYENDLNSPFVTWPSGDANGNDGILKLDAAVTRIDYFFHAHNEGVRNIGGVDYVFRKSADGLTLYAAVKGSYDGTEPAKTADVDFIHAKTEVIATITNNIAIATPWANGGRNKIELNRGDDFVNNLAKTMLNTQELTVDIMAVGQVCNDANKKVSITFQGEEYYTAKYIRPVNEPASTASNFIDGVDFGQPGSYLNVMNIVQLKDWRERLFSLSNTAPADPNNYFSYWVGTAAAFDLSVTPVTTDEAGGYYGIQTIELADGSECDLNGIRQAVPATIVLAQQDDATNLTSAGNVYPFGYVTYKNNGTTVTADYNLFLKFKVTYIWGEFTTDFITVPVKKTITPAPAPKK